MSTTVPDVSTPTSKAEWLSRVNKAYSVCTQCGLRANSLQVVPGTGPADAKIMIVGEAPGADEDQCGIPFSGRAGQLLTELLIKAGGNRDNIFITNVVKCRPVKNKDPEQSEIDTCFRYLYNQMLIIKPMMILTVGRISSSVLLEKFCPGFNPKSFKITKDHGRVYHCSINAYNFVFDIMPIMHTAYLLRGMNQIEIDDTVDDFKSAFRIIGQVLASNVVKSIQPTTQPAASRPPVYDDSLSID